jgi:putative ABC transport system permease protein
MRSFLTMLGIIIGIAAVITMVALGEGAQQQVQAQLQSLGTNVLTVRPGAEVFGRIDRGESRMTATGASRDPAGGHAIRAISPEMQRRQQVSYTNANANLQIMGAWPDYFPIQNHSLDFGRYFTAARSRAGAASRCSARPSATRLGDRASGR